MRSTTPLIKSIVPSSIFFCCSMYVCERTEKESLIVFLLVRCLWWWRSYLFLSFFTFWWQCLGCSVKDKLRLCLRCIYPNSLTTRPCVILYRVKYFVLVLSEFGILSKNAVFLLFNLFVLIFNLFLLLFMYVIIFFCIIYKFYCTILVSFSFFLQYL